MTMKDIFRKIFWRIKFLLFESWGKNWYIILYTGFPFVRKNEDARTKFIEKKGYITWDKQKATFSHEGIDFYYGKKLPVADFISIYLADVPFIKRNFINNSAFRLEGPYEQDGVSLENGDIVVDAGANIGLFSLFARKKVGDVGKVISFEPIEEARKILDHNIKTNGFNNIEIAPYALGDSVRKVEFYKDEMLGGSSTVLTNNKNIKEEVQQLTLDKFVVENNIARVNFIKADIEGMERFLLAGAEETIKKYKPKLAICIYHLPDDPEVIENMVKKFVPEYHIAKSRTKLYAWV